MPSHRLFSAFSKCVYDSIIVCDALSYSLTARQVFSAVKFATLIVIYGAQWYNIIDNNKLQFNQNPSRLCVWQWCSVVFTKQTSNFNYVSILLSAYINPFTETHTHMRTYTKNTSTNITNLQQNRIIMRVVSFSAV